MWSSQVISNSLPAIGSRYAIIYVHSTEMPKRVRQRDDLMFNFMFGDSTQPKGPPEMVKVVTAAVRHHNGAFIRQPLWVGETPSRGYWVARISTKNITKKDFFALLDDMNKMKIGVQYGSRADVQALP